MIDIYNFEQYSSRYLKIQTKTAGIQPFILRKYQQKYIDHLKNDFKDGIIRSIVLKPRQCGFSTLIAGYNTHNVVTSISHRGLIIADKYARTQAVHGIYSTMVDNIPKEILPMIAKKNESEILFDNPNQMQRDKFPGLSSGFVTETAQDKDSGKSSSRQFAHLSEFAFYPYAMELDQSVQNSIPLAKSTYIAKESTANGMAGDGEAFYQQYIAAERGESIYKAWFVRWFEVDDYKIEPERGFVLTKYEADLVLRFPGITNANLAWRRMKIREIHTSDDSGINPTELFKQDFPSFPEEAFLSTGSPVFDMEKVRLGIEYLRTNHTEKKRIVITQKNLSMFPDLLTVYEVPDKSKKYFIGADVAEGLALGDSSSAFIMDEDYKQVAVFHGKIDPDIFGRVLVELAKIYNRALIIPEKNNHGFTTINAIKQEGYFRVYMSAIDDEVEEHRETAKLGWVTTSRSKHKMLNAMISAFRDGELVIKDINLFREMLRVTRESNGDVVLNGRDRVVACCLAVIGTTQAYEPATVYSPEDKKERHHYEKRDESRKIALKEKR